MAYLRNGFTPTTTPDASNLGFFKVSAASTQSIAAGDCVVKNGTVLTRATAGQDPTDPAFGVVIAVYNSAGGPFTFNPTKFIASATYGYATVCTDPNQEYLVRCETSVGNGDIGKNVTIDQSAPNAALGRSGQAVTIPASASINDLFKLVRVYEGENLTGTSTVAAGAGAGAAGCGVIVTINRGTFNAATASQ